MEQLLSRKEVSARLGIKPRTFSRHKARFIAAGLQVVQLGKRPKYRAASLDLLIRKAAETGTSL